MLAQSQATILHSSKLIQNVITNPPGCVFLSHVDDSEGHKNDI